MTALILGVFTGCPSPGNRQRHPDVPAGTARLLGHQLRRLQGGPQWDEPCAPCQGPRKGEHQASGGGITYIQREG